MSQNLQIPEALSSDTLSSPAERRAPFKAGLVWTCFALLLFVISLRSVSPHDIWFIVLMGKWVIENLAVPHHEFFLYTADGAPEMFGAWGFGVLMELARRAAGLYGLVAMNAILWGAAYLFAFTAIRLRLGKNIFADFHGAEIVGIGIATLLLYEAIVQRTSMRPEVTIFLAWAIISCLMEYGRRNRNFRAALVFCPLVVWCEAWIHTAGPVLLVPIGAYCAEALIEQLRQKPIPAPRTVISSIAPWGLSLLAAVILPVINPNGIPQVYAHLDMLLQIFFDKGGLLSGLEISNPGMPVHDTKMINIEYLAAWEWPPFYHLYALVVCSAIILMTSENRRFFNFVSIFPVAVFGILHIRGLGLLAWSLIIPLGVATTEISQMVGKQIQNKSTQKSLWLQAGLYLSFFVIAGGLFAITEINSLFMKLPLTMPLAKSMEQIRKSAPNGGNIFTDLHLGAITAWSLGEKYKVPVAAHIMVDHPEMSKHLSTVSFLKNGWEDDLKRYNVVAFVIEPNNLFDGRIKPVVLRLAYHPSWQFSDYESNVATFLHRGTNSSEPSQGAQIQQIQRYWKEIYECAKNIYTATPYPKTLRTLKISKQFLEIADRVDLSQSQKLELLTTSAKALPEWHGDISAE